MTETGRQIRHVVGVMTGTSIDGIDAALVKIAGGGLSMRASLVGQCSKPLGQLALGLRRAAEQALMTSGELAKLAWEFGQLHCDVVEQLLRGHDRDLALICVHGQTVYHQPPVSWQLINTAPIGARFKCPIVGDLRQADLATGGQGAPITPLADWVLFRDLWKRRAIVNLGGFCNVTILPSADGIDEEDQHSDSAQAQLNEIRGFDVCACNQVLDAVARIALKAPFDVDGAAACRGRACPHAASALYQILKAQREGSRSLGTCDEALKWVNDYNTRIAPDDLAATAVDAIARSIVDAIASFDVDEFIIAGGGAHNRSMLQTIERVAAKPLITTATLGVPIEMREAMGFAVLGALCADHVPITLPRVTGCSSPAPLAGSWLCPAGGISANATSPEAPVVYRE